MAEFCFFCFSVLFLRPLVGCPDLQVQNHCSISRRSLHSLIYFVPACTEEMALFEYFTKMQIRTIHAPRL